MSEFHDYFKDNPILFLKFIEEKYLQSFIDGNIFVNNFEFFQKLEAQYGDKGIGDKNDGCLPIFNLQKLVFHNYETGEIICEIPQAPEIKFQQDRDSKTPVFCLYEMKAEDFNVINESKDEIRILLHFSEDKRKKILKEFSSKSHVVLIDPYLFISRVESACTHNNISVCYNRVQYYKYGVNDKKRLLDYKTNSSDKYFWKDDYFTDQCEYRFVFVDRQIESGRNIINVGNLLEIGTYMTISQLLERDYVIAYGLSSEE